jgi:hypothetical protein
MKITISVSILASLLMLPSHAVASCGAAQCMVNTQWDTLGTDTGSGWRADIHIDAINADQLRHGTHKASDADALAAGEEILEDYTRSLNTTLVLDYSPSRAWGLNVSLPVVGRHHQHFDTTVPVTESWNFHRLGDARLTGRMQLTQATNHEIGLRMGLKLPTGTTDLSNGDGTPAERALQPGTGTTDLIAGLYADGTISHEWRWFSQLAWQHALNSHKEFEPGDSTSLDLGLGYNPYHALSLMLQLNGLVRGHDSGADSEPDMSGGRYLSVSPGFSYGFTAQTQVYGYVQLPVYQWVRGYQLTADHGLTLGLRHSF